jgi:hypothetical protein
MKDSTHLIKIVSHGVLLSWYLFEAVEGEIRQTNPTTTQLAASIILIITILVATPTNVFTGFWVGHSNDSSIKDWD